MLWSCYLYYIILILIFFTHNCFSMANLQANVFDSLLTSSTYCSGTKTIDRNGCLLFSSVSMVTMIGVYCNYIILVVFFTLNCFRMAKLLIILFVYLLTYLLAFWNQDNWKTAWWLFRSVSMVTAIVPIGIVIVYVSCSQ